MPQLSVAANLRMFTYFVALWPIATASCQFVDIHAVESSPQSVRPLTVRDILAAPQSYHGKLISVRGVYYYGLRDPSCTTSFPDVGHTWPCALNFVKSEQRGDGDPPVRFRTDEQSWARLINTVRREAMNGRKCEIWVTVVGQLRVFRTPLKASQSQIGGFGHLGIFPAELVVERVVDIEVKDKETYDYSITLHPHPPPRP